MRCMRHLAIMTDMTRSIRAHALAVVTEGERENIELQSAGGITQLATMVDEAARAIDAVGGRRGCAIIPLTEQGHELIFLAAIAGAERAICALKLQPDTGDPMRDLVLVTDMTGERGGRRAMNTS